MWKRRRGRGREFTHIYELLISFGKREPVVYLRFLVFWSGFITLAAELSASRLIAPYFGTSLVVWSCLIGLILVSLAAGYALGGRIADKYGSLSGLLNLAAAGAVLIMLTPFFSRIILHKALIYFIQYKFALLIGSFISVLLFMSLPMILMGTITPYAIRLLTTDVQHAGKVAGNLIAISTLGGFIGSFLPTLVLIPAWGTSWTFTFLGLSLLFVVIMGFLLIKRILAAGVLVILGLGMLGWNYVHRPSQIKPGDGVLFEKESSYHYVRVVEDLAGWRTLTLNEGVVAHSKFHPNLYFTGGEWDYMALAPLFRPAPGFSRTHLQRWALIGAGAGTLPRLLKRIYPAVQIIGIELDPVILEAGRKHFELNDSGMQTLVQDGRAWLNTTTNTYDIIAVDAYRQPYVPFELTTLEFFRKVKAQLYPHGVVAINIGHTERDHRLLDAISATMGEVFDLVFHIGMSHGKNTVAIGTQGIVSLQDVQANSLAVNHSVLRLIVRRALPFTKPANPRQGMVLTDDHAPVERMIDLMVAREILAIKK